MSKQIKTLVFLGFLGGLFLHALLTYHINAAPVQGSVALDQTGTIVTSAFLGCGVGLFCAAAMLVNLKFLLAFLFLIGVGALGSIRRNYFGYTYFQNPIYIALHLVLGFAMTCSFFEFIPAPTDFWYWGVFLMSSILAPISFYVLAGIFAFFLAKSFIHSIMELFA